MLKRRGGFGAMDASEIKALRTLLASEAAAQTEPRRASGLGRLFARPSPSRPAPAPEAPRTPDPLDLDPLAPPPELEALAAAPMDGAIQPIDALPISAPPMGLWLPRRAAFGQRRAVRQEIVLDLVEPAPSPLTRLMLTSPDGARVGEIILHPGEGAPPAARRPFEPLHAETPFFPEDLEDRPAHRPAPALAPALATAPPPTPKPPKARAQKAGPEMASTFLLAGLAARLAHEEAALSARIAALA
jgi:hypothetical protein